MSSLERRVSEAALDSQECRSHVIQSLLLQGGQIGPDCRSIHPTFVDEFDHHTEIVIGRAELAAFLIEQFGMVDQSSHLGPNLLTLLNRSRPVMNGTHANIKELLHQIIELAGLECEHLERELIHLMPGDLFSFSGFLADDAKLEQGESESDEREEETKDTRGVGEMIDEDVDGLHVRQALFRSRI
jgi:hypothetical protein